ncbi:MAG: 30S ribosomal protein S17 [Gammaproteobacteria bacterium]|nr:30S ribosomal protein S17 [Gammaproteobacteria bacterium]
MTATQTQKSPRRTLMTGTVVSSKKMNSTIIVRVKRKVRHPIYGKFITRFSKLYAHDAEGLSSEGDTVEIQMCKPISKNKSWTLVRVVDHHTQDLPVAE